MSAPPPSLVAACRRIGARVPFWTQGAGSNISLKVDDQLWIKASGARLDEVTESAGLVVKPLASTRERLVELGVDAEEAYAALLVAPSGAPRPSMETGFHLLLPASWVAHFHALAAIILAHQRQREPEAVDRWVASATPLHIAFLPYERPGLRLARLVGDAPAADVYVLANHGVVLIAEENGFAERLQAWERFETSVLEHFGYAELRALAVLPTVDVKKLLAAALGPLRICFPDIAVFRDRLEPLLLGQGSERRLPPAAVEGSRDLAEVWLAAQLLYRAVPDLAELDTLEASGLRHLPTEQFRRKERS